MAPLLRDRLLPFMKPVHALASPRTREEWKPVLENVKALYMERRYKQCASRATEVLNGAKNVQVIYKVFLHYYRAISYEIMGHSAHNYSSNKVPMLEWARDDFIACSKLIPELRSIPDIPDIPATRHPSDQCSTSPTDSKFPEGSSTAESSVEPPKLSEGKDKSRALDLEALLSIERMSGDAIVAEWARKLEYSSPIKNDAHASLIPSPLRIRKPPRTEPTDASPTKIPRPRPVISANRDISSGINGVKSHPKPTPLRSSVNKLHSKETDQDPALAESIARYSVISLSFSSQVNKNISSVTSLITLVRKIQRAHQATRDRRLASFWSFPTPDTKGDEKEDSYPGSDMLPDPFVSAENLDENAEQRISRLRTEEWKTVGLKSQKRGWKGSDYYQQFCSLALAELYEGGQIATTADPEQVLL